MNLKKAPIHIHHIASHFTSALFPVSTALLTMFVITGEPSFEAASFYCIAFGLPAIPAAFFSGAYDWRTRFSARHTRIFNHKLFFGALFIVVGLGLIVARIMWPQIMFDGGAYKWIYFGALCSATGMAAYLGHLGSKFI